MPVFVQYSNMLRARPPGAALSLALDVNRPAAFDPKMVGSLSLDRLIVGAAQQSDADGGSVTRKSTRAQAPISLALSI